MRKLKLNSEDNNTASLKILDRDPWLEPYGKDLEFRTEKYRRTKERLLRENKSLKEFANGHLFFGFHRLEDGWVYREWAPAADSLFLIGDFNKWNRISHPMENKGAGVWEIFIPGRDSLPHGSKVKVSIQHQGEVRDRIPLYIKKVIQDTTTKDFSGQIWDCKYPYEWRHKDYKRNIEEAPLIYEAHIGMSQEKEDIASYREFADYILPRVKELGYNTIQLMAIMEHPYYASFGYHVSNFFAASSWFGATDDLKYLIDKAHGMGISVIMDLIHSHSIKNYAEGIRDFDGTTTQFFHEGQRGYHSAWDSYLFNYGKDEVIHFLLSNIKFWMEEYQFDGFRFDGVTSMIYKDHGLGTAFDSYEKYFSSNTDVEALTYLQLANELIKEINPYALTIAEDMSGMPGMCLPIGEGGIGFDYRLAMGMPDFWINTLKVRDEDWDMEKLMHELTTSRPGEKQIAYVESHDQGIVGDKTLIFRMADQEMYWHMSKKSENLIIDRAIALHKMIRLITISTGSEGYLNFMGNEFGHPEWIDFPREGNNWSFKHCKRKWSLADNPSLRYSELNKFDGVMIHLMRKMNLMGGKTKCLWLDGEKKVIAFEKKDCLWIFNFHPQDSYPHFELPLFQDGCYQVILDTDQVEFGGLGRIPHDVFYEVQKLPLNSKEKGIIIYLPSRCAMVLKRVRDYE
jgi:1,4-alpha-glucan branching enzyme